LESKKIEKVLGRQEKILQNVCQCRIRFIGPSIGVQAYISGSRLKDLKAEPSILPPVMGSADRLSVPFSIDRRISHDLSPVEEHSVENSSHSLVRISKTMQD
jgi:hypothetical protein